VLKEVGKAVLAVLLLQGSYIVYDVEIRASLVLIVMTEVIGQSVFELSYSGVRIVRDPFLCLQFRHHKKGQSAEN
jgi:hypothetical protein